MKVKVSLKIEEQNHTRTFTLKELGVTSGEWSSMDEEARHQLLYDIALDIEVHAHWDVEGYKEIT